MASRCRTISRPAINLFKSAIAKPSSRPAFSVQPKCSSLSLSQDIVSTEFDMEPTEITKGRYTYVHDVKKGSPEAIDVHHIMVSTSFGGFFLCTHAFLFVIIGLLILTLLRNTTSVSDKPVASVLGSFTLAGFFLRQLLRKQVKKESVVILPAFGVQLETTYRSGKIVRRFVSFGKILKPVLNECVTPVTCYWSLSLILRGEDELLLVFKELYPPVTMLVPIWKKLCASIDDEECIGLCTQNMVLDGALRSSTSKIKGCKGLLHCDCHSELCE